MEIKLLENKAARPIHTIVYQSLDQLKKVYSDLEIENVVKDSK